MNRTRIVYASYNALSEPLVQSQVLPYLRHLVAAGYRFHLLTVEQGVTDRTFGETGIEWQPVKRSRFPWVTITRLAARIKEAHEGEPLALIHARSYVPATAAALASHRIGAPWLFDMRGFWVDEKLLRGVLKGKNLIYRLMKRWERWLLRRADALVSLTRRALPEIEQILGEPLPPHAVIPTCVDLERFTPRQDMDVPHDHPVFGYIGSLGRGYAADRLARFLCFMLDRFPASRALLVTRSSGAEMEQLLEGLGPARDRVEVTCAEHHEMPEQVRKMTIGISFIPNHFSKLASCPTKLGEYLACGVPVINNSGIGDVETWFADPAAGIVLGPDELENPESAIRWITERFGDLQTATACRGVAERLFNARKGAERYEELYREMMRTA